MATKQEENAWAWRGVLMTFVTLPNVTVSLIGIGTGSNHQPSACPNARIMVKLRYGEYRFMCDPDLLEGTAAVKLSSATTSRTVKYENVLANVLAQAAKADTKEAMEQARFEEQLAKDRIQTQLYGRPLNALVQLAQPLFFKGQPDHYGDIHFVRGEYQWGSYACRVDVPAGRVHLELAWDVSPTLLANDPTYGDAPVRAACEAVIRVLLNCQQAYADKAKAGAA